jgi:hypothetical protein
MPHLAPIVIPSGESVVGQSLQFHAYSLRVDNLTNQWLQEESSLAWIPPYSLGTCLRLYGTAVAIILNRAPSGQPQLAPIVGEYTSGFFSDEYRTEVAGAPVRQFTLVQSVSDLTQGPQPALPPVGVDRLYADSSGNIHHLHSNGTDLTLVDPSNAGTLLYPTFDPHYQALVNATALGGELHGTVSNAVINNGAITSAKINPNTLDLRPQIVHAGDIYTDRGDASGFIFFGSAASRYCGFDGNGYVMPAAGLTVGSYVIAGSYLQAPVHYCPDTSSYFTGTGGHILSRSAVLEIQTTGGTFGQIWTGGITFDYSGTNTGTGYASGTGIQFAAGSGEGITSQRQGGGPNQFGIDFWTASNRRVAIQNGGSLVIYAGIAMSANGTAMGWPNGSYISGNAGYVQGSRRALKQSIATLSDSDLLARVADARLPVSSYLWPDDERRNIGFIADDIALVLPEAVVRDDNGEPSGYNAQELTAMLWGAVRALNGRVDQLVNAA